MSSLDLQYNGIAALLDLRPLGALTELRLDHNDLTTLERVQGLSQVTKLSARANAISRLGDDVTSLTSLEVLDLADNRLEAGPWVSVLARLPALRELDVRGNPVCALAGSQELLKAALPGLAVLNGRRVAQQEPTLAPAALQQQPQQFEGPHTDSQSAQGDRGYDDMGRLPTFSPRALPSTAAGASRGPQDGAVPWPGSTSSWPDDREVQVQLAADFEALLAEHTSLSQRATSLEASLQAAEDAQTELQQRLHDQVSSFAQQATSTAGQISALVAERDAAVRHADALAAQLVDAQAAAAAAAHEVAQLRQVASESEDRERALQQELAATQELLLSQAQQAAVVARSAMDAHAAAAGEQQSHRQGVGVGRSASPGRLQAGEAALQALRVSSLQQIVQMQERELVRLGMGGDMAPPPPGSPPRAGPTASPARSPTVRWENLLRPWREQVQALHEQNARQAAEVAEQRQEWARQLGEMQEQFMSTRTLIEVLEQRLREQRAEKQQLALQARQRQAELESAHQRAAYLEQQLSSREAAAQAVRRQLLAFKAATEQQVAGLEARAGELDAHASRLSFACQRLVFVLSLAAARVRSPGGMAAGAGVSGVGIGRGAVVGAMSQVEAGRANGAGAGSSGCNRPLVEVLQQEVAKMGHDRDVLLKQLAQVSASAEERIRQAQEVMQERESRHRDALISTRVQAQVEAMQAALASQINQIRQQVASAVYAAEEVARSTEAAAGVRLSRLAVRMQELNKQVVRLRSAKQRDAAVAAAAALERQQLCRQLAQVEADAADLRRKLAGLDAEAHAKVAELNVVHEAALAAERRRTSEAERLANKAAAECGHMERDLARAREAKAQQDDARTRRLQAQLRDQELQLRSLRRERNSLLAMLKTHGINSDAVAAAAQASDTSQVADTQPPPPPPADGGDEAVVIPSPEQQHDRRDVGKAGPQQPSGSGTGGLISSILRGSHHTRKAVGIGRVQVDPA
ncbi:hypothetical protein CHLRE_12g561150v5 [Chlamydomonas reinhardtii]|uniref:Uncharacterized protein n=1 Tax=Chlamydomonas reinhardtii TaxID=3055 RepID=A0A2K3D5F6_CHLRE|nr:uncharacterized protein CHLRE_12g561150v5 [Chlamydomonas reinhardtii]PNW75772.1 hypothetical protein CHLRE_12g561150v5 [Chlamydomonas reinhardtii]